MGEFELLVKGGFLVDRASIVPHLSARRVPSGRHTEVGAHGTVGTVTR